MASKQTGWTCEDCGTAYRLKIFTCPRCRGTRFVEVGGMAKISTFGGVTNVKAAGLVPGVAGDLPEEHVTRADGSSEVVNGEVEEVDEPAADDAPDADSDKSDDSDDSGKRDTDDEGTDPDPGADGDPASDDEDGEDGPPFDPTPLTVAEVNVKLQGLTDDARARVLDAERAGKNRQGIIG